MKIQIIGASAEHARVASVAEAVLSIPGCSLEFVWWVDARDWSGRDRDADDATCRFVAEQNARAIRDANLILHLAPNVRSIGAAFEFGYAVACGKTVFTSGPASRDTVHRAHGNVVVFASDEEAIHSLDARASCWLRLHPEVP